MGRLDKPEIHIRSREQIYYEVQVGSYLVAVVASPDEALRIVEDIYRAKLRRKRGSSFALAVAQ